MTTTASFDKKPVQSDRRQATVIFADISGFTALSEKMDPEDVADTMNDCFRIVEQIVIDRGGTIDKYIGDCVMALFGAPKALENAPRQALNAAIEIRAQLARINDERRLPAHLDVHIGINTGLVVAGDMGGDVKRDYTVMGSTVNLASRLEAIAENGQIFVGANTHRYTSHEFDFKRVDGLTLKGIDGPVTAYELTSREERVHRARPGDERHGLSSPLVGRDRELRRIEEQIERLVRGVGGIASVVAENGMGKSRLLAELESRESTRRVHWLEARSLSVGQGLSFHPFIDLLESWAGIAGVSGERERTDGLYAAIDAACPEAPAEVGAAVATMMGLALDADRARTLADLEGEALEKVIHRAVRTILEAMAEQGPSVLVFEDLHWADQSSVAMLESLLTLAESRRLLFLLVERPGYEATGDRILRYIDEHLSAHHAAIRLEPLDDRHLDALIDNLLGDAELSYETRTLIKERTDGNPFYVEEVLRSLIEQGALSREKRRAAGVTELPGVEIPGTIEEVIMARVDRLDAPVRALLQVMSVIGRRFYRRILEHVVDRDVDVDTAVAVLVAKQFLFEVASRRTSSPRRASLVAEVEYVFKHAMVQETVYGSLLKRARRELHTRCAAAIETMFADRLQDVYGMLAYHYTRGDRIDKAEEYLFKAGEEAARTAASSEALHYFKEAYASYVATHGDEADDSKKALLEKNIGLALLNIGNLTESIAHFNNALTLYGEKVPTTPTALKLKLAVDLPRVLFHLYFGSRERARRRGRENDHDLFQIMYNRCRAQNIVDAERNFFDNLAAMAHLRHLDPATVDDACGLYASTGAFFAFAGLSFSIGRRFLDVAETLVREDRARDRFQYASMASVLDFHQGDWSGSRDMDDPLFEQGLRAGLLWNADVYLGMVCEREMHRGRFAAAAEHIERLKGLSRDFGYDFAKSNEYAMTAFLLLEERRLDDAHEAIGLYHDSRYESTLRLLALSVRARVELLSGELEAAAATLGEARGIVDAAERIPPFYLGAYRTSRLALLVERLEQGPDRVTAREARRAAKEAAEAAAHMARERVTCASLTGRMQWLAGHHARALTAWRDAVAEAERLGALPDLGRTWTEIGRSLAEPSGPDTLGDTDSAGAFAKARTIFDDLGLGWDGERLDQLAGSSAESRTRNRARGMGAAT